MLRQMPVDEAVLIKEGKLEPNEAISLSADEAEQVKKGILNPADVSISEKIVNSKLTQGFSAYYDSLDYMTTAAFYIVAKGWTDNNYT